MMWQTHAAIGGNVVWLLVASGAIAQPRPLLVSIAAFAALLPDIDATNARIHHVNYKGIRPFAVIGQVVNSVFGHRKFIHSLAAMFLVLMGSLLAFRNYSLDIPLAIALGYASHCLIDGFNRAGVQYLWPWRRKFNLAPRFLRFEVRSPWDFLLFFVGVLGLVALLA